MVRKVLVGPHGIGRYLGDQRDVLLGGQARYEIVELENNADVLTSLDVRPRSPRAVSSVLRKKSCPLVGRPRPPIMFNNVDLPLPDGPSRGRG